MKSSRRKSEFWISNNKVLTGGISKKPHIRNPNFEADETQYLIKIWGDPKIQRTLLTTHRKLPVIQSLADRMRAKGYFRSVEEINTRIKNLKCLYNRIKKDIDLGIISEPTWRHYSSIDDIMTRPMFGRPAHFTPNTTTISNSILNRKVNVIIENDDDMNENESDEFDDDDDDDDNTDNDDDEDDQIYDGTIIRASDLLNTDGNSIKIEDELMVPKEEPLDLDDDVLLHHNISENDDDMDLPVLLPKNLSSSLKITPITTNATCTTTQGKISLVPTNILLKPTQPNNITFKQSPQIIYTKAPSSTPTSNSLSTVTMSSAAGGSGTMKVLVVNRLQNNTTELNTINIPKETVVPATITTNTPKIDEIKNKGLKKQNSELTRTILNQLLQIQSQNLQVSRQRMQMEKERFEFEKSIAEKLLGIFHSKNNNDD